MSKERKHMSVRLRACIAALAAVVALLAPAAAQAAAVPANFWGIVPQAAPTEEQLERLERGGVESLRVAFNWPSVQSKQGAAPEWAVVDLFVKRAASAGIDVLPFVTGAPSWAVPAVPVPGAPSLRAPAHLPVSGVGKAGWAGFLKAAVQRYGPNGTLWAENPAVPKHPVRVWQVWNEPNFKYFAAHPSPAEYGKLVKASYAALKSADPGAQVILAGLYSRPIEAIQNYKPPRAFFATDFLEQMYKKTPGVKSKFNGVALHPYTGRYSGLTSNIEDLRTVLKANHDAGKGLWITELGWSSKPPTDGNSYAKGVNGQAQQLRGAFTLLTRNMAKWKIKRVYWFSVDDQEATCNFCDGSGLFGAGFVPKKAWYEYVKFTGGTP
jgi:hypothetical protein